jgi:hypothetical protein
VCEIRLKITEDAFEDTGVVFPRIAPPAAWEAEQSHTGSPTDFYVFGGNFFPDTDDRDVVAMSSLSASKRPECIEVSGRPAEPKGTDVQDPHVRTHLPAARATLPIGTHLSSI